MKADRMKQLEFKPAVNFEPYVKLPLQEALNAKDLENESKNLNVTVDSQSKNEIQENLPLGIEIGMVYIAVPVSVIVWIGLVYSIKVMLF